EIVLFLLFFCRQWQFTNAPNINAHSLAESFHVWVFCIDDGTAFCLGDSHDLNVKFYFGPSLYALALLLILDCADQFSGLYCCLNTKSAQVEFRCIIQALE